MACALKIAVEPNAENRTQLLSSPNSTNFIFCWPLMLFNHQNRGKNNAQNPLNSTRNEQLITGTFCTDVVSSASLEPSLRMRSDTETTKECAHLHRNITDLNAALSKLIFPPFYYCCRIELFLENCPKKFLTLDSIVKTVKLEFKNFL